MKFARRVTVKNVTFSDLSGGVNVSMNADAIKETEMQQCENMLYDVDSNVLTKRGGLSIPIGTYPSDILAAYNDFEMNRHFVFLTSGEIYVSDISGVSSYIGMLNGIKRPKCTKFGGNVYICSGGHIQYFDGINSVIEIGSSPLADFCFVREGRLFCFVSGDDYAYYSATGDASNWDDNANDDSASTWVEIGYKDDGNILDAVGMASDIIFFKSNGLVYQLSGTYPNWEIPDAIVEDSGFDTRLCACGVGSDVLYLGRFGLNSLYTTEKYGNVALNTSIGSKFNKIITSDYYNPKMWKLPRLKCLFINPNCGKNIIAYNYSLKVATTLTFPFEIIDVFENSRGVVIVSKRSLYYMDRQYLTDDGVPITCKFVTKVYPTIYEGILITMLDMLMAAETSGVVNVRFGNFNANLPNNERVNIKLNHVVDNLVVTVSSTDDLILNRLTLEVADV